MKSSQKYYWLLLLIPVFFIVWFFVSKQENKPERFLPYYGPKNALKINDTTYHKVSSFEFTSQDNDKVNLETVKGKIFVTEFFFTTCQSICPVMNSQLKRVYAEFKSDPDFLILSHTVDPETDSVSVLKSYADAHGVNDKKWLFLTGAKKDLYDAARQSYLLDAGEGSGDDEDFIHTQNFALVDKQFHLRGFYDGTDSLEIDKMIREIKLLKKEYEYKSKSN